MSCLLPIGTCRFAANAEKNKNWCLMFNSTKCKVMSLGRCRIPPVYTMSLCDGSTLKLECTNLEKEYND